MKNICKAFRCLGAVVVMTGSFLTTIMNRYAKCMAVAFVACSVPAFGQEHQLDGVSSEGNRCEFIWGPRASFDIFGCDDSADMSRRDSDEIGLGCSAGIVGRFMWNRRWFVESAFQVSYGNSPVQVEVLSDKNGNPAALHGTYTLSRGAIQIPVHLGVRWDLGETLGIGVFTGVRMSWGFAGSLSDGPSYMPRYELYGDNGVWRRFGIAPVIGVEFWCARNLSVAVTGDLGVNNMARKPIFASRRMNESECRIALTYWLGRKN